MTKTLVALVGTKYRGAEAEATLASLPQGEPLALVREPTNRFDPAAVQVWARGVQIGFLKSSQVRAVAWKMDRKLAEDPAATFQGKLAIDGGRQPMVEIE
jgi:HIRAN domain-containing protein